jgi:hypothetical protein
MISHYMPEDLRSPPKGADRSVSEDRFAIAPEGGRSSSSEIKTVKSGIIQLPEDLPLYAVGISNLRSLCDCPEGADRSGSDDITLDAAAAPSGIEDRPRRGQIGYAYLTRRERQQHRCALSPCPLRGQQLPPAAVCGLRPDQRWV